MNTVVHANAGRYAAPGQNLVRDLLLPCPVRAALCKHTGALAPNALACIHYGLEPVTSDDPRVLHVPLAVLSGGMEAEMWSAGSPVHMGVIEDIHYAHEDEVLFAWLRLGEAALVSIEQASLHAYRRLGQLLVRLGFPHWLRAWNYLARITEGEGERERYRQFNAGRFHALALKPDFEATLPAATAIGTQGGGLTVGLLAGRRAALQVENPRQVSAFHYPRRYGLRSPSFSRATLQHWRECSMLLLSGTASVVGHLTQCPGDSSGQLQETLRNIEALLAHTAERHFPGQDPSGFEPQAFKVYVRSPEVYGRIAQQLDRLLAARAPTLVLQGEICRPDLLLEIEGVYGWQAGSE